MMHDFNSVSGMWSDIQLKGRAGRRGGEGTNRRNRERERKKRGGGIPPRSPLLGGGLDRARASREERKRWRVEERRGMEGRGWCGFCLLPTFQSQS